LSVPDWWEATLLALAAWRVFQLFSHDDILDRPRRYVTRLPRRWTQGSPIPKEYRENLVDFLECPYCFGFWIAIVWFAAWELWPHATLVASVPLALSAGLIAAAKVLSSE